MKGNRSFYVFVASMIVLVSVLFFFMFALLCWSGSHPSQKDTVNCIRAGYDGARWETFAPDGYCYKNVPFSEALKQQ